MTAGGALRRRSVERRPSVEGPARRSSIERKGAAGLGIHIDSSNLDSGAPSPLATMPPAARALAARVSFTLCYSVLCVCVWELWPCVAVVGELRPLPHVFKTNCVIRISVACLLLS